MTINNPVAFFKKGQKNDIISIANPKSNIIRTYIGFFGPFMASNTEIKNDELIIIHIPHYLYDWIKFKNKESLYIKY